MDLEIGILPLAVLKNDNAYMALSHTMLFVSNRLFDNMWAFEITCASDCFPRIKEFLIIRLFIL